MIEFIVNNLGTIIVAMIIAVIVAIVISLMVRNRKAGKSSCGCGCGDCPLNGKCHSADSVGKML